MRRRSPDKHDARSFPNKIQLCQQMFGPREEWASEHARRRSIHRPRRPGGLSHEQRPRRRRRRSRKNCLHDSIEYSPLPLFIVGAAVASVKRSSCSSYIMKASPSSSVYILNRPAVMAWACPSSVRGSRRRRRVQCHVNASSRVDPLLTSPLFGASETFTDERGAREARTVSQITRTDSLIFSASFQRLISAWNRRRNWPPVGRSVGRLDTCAPLSSPLLSLIHSGLAWAPSTRPRPTAKITAGRRAALISSLVRARRGQITIM